MTNGVIIDAESRLLLIAMVGYRPNEYTNTHINAHTHTVPSLCLLLTYEHTQTHTHIFIFSGSRRCTYAHKPSTSANKLTHPDIPLATSRDPLCSCTHMHTNIRMLTHLDMRITLCITRQAASVLCTNQSLHYFS